MNGADLIRSLQVRVDDLLVHRDDIEAYLLWSSINARQLNLIGEWTLAEGVARRAVSRGIDAGREELNSFEVSRSELINALLGLQRPETLEEIETLARASPWRRCW